MAPIYHYNSINNNYTALKVLYAPSTHFPPTLVNTDLYIVYMLTYSEIIIFIIILGFSATPSGAQC